MLNRTRLQSALIISLLIPAISHGEETMDQVSISGNDIRIEGVSIQSEEKNPNNKKTIQRNIQVGHIVNSSNGGSSQINIGNIGGDESSQCNKTDKEPQLVTVVGSNKTVKITQAGKFHLCVEGSNNSVLISPGSQIGPLVIYGGKNRISIEKNSSVEFITLHGDDNKINKPKDLKLNIDAQGQGNQVFSD